MVSAAIAKPGYIERSRDLQPNALCAKDASRLAIHAFTSFIVAEYIIF
jgi:hypothetical protein